MCYGETPTLQHIRMQQSAIAACHTEILTSEPEFGELHLRGSERHYLGLGHQHSVQPKLHSHGYPAAHVPPHPFSQHAGGPLEPTRAAATSGAL
ncbi:hypothetical protein Mapa_002749 [Marchantia paleacea]|nr:hypothetical protein Mapa_002749 [Marchantia paleacea]